MTKASRFALATRMLRRSGKLDVQLPGQRSGESPLDWMVRYGLAPSPQGAAEGLIAAHGLTALLDELCAEGVLLE